MITTHEQLVEQLVGDLTSVHAPTGRTLHCRGWEQEAALRMLCNNLDPAVAEDPTELVVYGGTGRAAALRRARPAWPHHPHGGARRHGRRAATGRHTRRGRDPVRRGRS